ncbi:DUF1996 domain-containing protein [Streptomyces sp. B6B3]|uniref:DUF1996 domain-containing protein n=1 Tax=Streptomyces sp. B6B3 TaxID=3153570 RepID=UPI00325E4055
MRIVILAVVTTLVVGGGGAVVISQTASAWGSRDDDGHDGRHDGDGRGGFGQSAGWWWGTIVCPDVGQELQEVPEGTEEEVGADLAELDAQVAEAYTELAVEEGDPEAVLGALEAERQATIDEMVDTLGSRGGWPSWLDWLEGLDDCEIRPPDEDDEPEDPEDPEVPVGGPVPEDFVDITTVEPNVAEPVFGENASTGSFTVDCGVNENGHFNTDNVIAAPGVSNGAHHLHDYVGNVSTDAFSTDESLLAADTTCVNGDQSTHYWPVLRVPDGEVHTDHFGDGGDQGEDGQDEGEDDGEDDTGGDPDGNNGTVLQPTSATLTFVGNPLGPVVEMPQFLRIITGDAKSFTNGTANANASWSCTGFEDRQLTDRYPLCPEGSEVVRSFDFQSCWDGVNTDSANHRDHVAFAAEDGSCPEGFQAIPQLTHRITYDIPDDAPADTPFALDSFPEQLHKPVTDHSDFINVMSDELMAETVNCINSGTDCG